MNRALRILPLLAFVIVLAGAAGAATSGFILAKGQTAQPFKDITISFVSAHSDFFTKQAILEVSGAAHPKINCDPNDTKPNRANLNYGVASILSPLGGSTTTSSTCTTDSGSFVIFTYRDDVSKGKVTFFISVKPKDNSKAVIITSPTGKTLAEVFRGQAAPSTGTASQSGATSASGTGTQAAAKTVILDSVNPNMNIDLSNFQSLEVIFTPHFAIKQYTVEIWQSKDGKPVENTRKQIASCKSGTNCIELVANTSNYAADNKMAVKLELSRDTAFKAAIDKIKSELALMPSSTYCLRVEVTDSENPGANRDNWVDTDCTEIKFNALVQAEPAMCPQGSNVLECLAYIGAYRFVKVFK